MPAAAWCLADAPSVTDGTQIWLACPTELFNASSYILALAGCPRTPRTVPSLASLPPAAPVDAVLQQLQAPE